MAFNVTEIKAYDAEGTAFNGLNASNVPINLNPGLDVVFSADVASSSVLSYAVTLFRTLADGGNSTPVDISLSQPSSNTVRIKSASPLIVNSSYNVYIPKGAFGIKSSEGETLASSFSFSFNTGVEESEAPTTEEDGIPPQEEVVVEDLQEIPEEVFLLSSIPDPDSIMQYGSGIVTVKFDGRLPTDTTVDVEVMHPLGFMFETASIWKEHLKPPVVDGGTITLFSKATAAELGEDIVERLVKIGEDPIKANSVPYSKYDSESGEYHLDFDLNRIFNIDFNISVNEITSSLSFMGFLYPYYGNIREIRLDIGPFVTEYNDFTLALIVHRHSITAEQLWPNNMPTTVPTRVSEYVTARTKKDILSTFFTSGERISSLGDLRISGKDVSSYLNDTLEALELRIVALENQVKKGDSSASPYTYYSHKSLPVSTTSASVGEDIGTSFGSRSLGRSFESKTGG